MNADENCMEGQSNHVFIEEQKVPFDDVVNIKKIHANIIDEDIPKVSLEFETEEQAYSFYNHYAYKIGFSIRRSKGHKDNKDGKMKSRMFCCSCEGFRKKDKRYDNVRCHRAQTRFGYLARMKIKLHECGKYKVVDFIAEHTHVNASADMSHLHRSRRKITNTQAYEIALVESSGIAPKAGMELMIKRAGGHANLAFILDDC